ncbi:uncharacterized protein LOC143877961 [Tasmannia lanceolata]|uniref:uncharacterized protein LOC143877961 n=1 Tax=Tasmannia lanceolata TaxID=3420 RepID=UPI00406457CD
MGPTEGDVENDFLERRLLVDDISHKDSETEDGTILYTASFQEMEANYVKYQTAQWIVYSLLLILALGIGFFMLLYLPIRRSILRKDFRSRKLYVTPDAIVYKVTRSVLFPSFGVLKKEKHVLLPAVSDIIVEQGYFQSHFGIYSVRIENAGIRRPPSDDVQIQGLAHPRDFRKAVLTRLSNLRNESFARQLYTSEDQPNIGSGYPSGAWVRQNIGTSLTPQPMSPSRYLRHDSFHSAGELVLQKLKEVESSVKRVENLIEDHHCQTSDSIV